MNIADLFLKYDTDKETAHKYGKIYDSIFFNFDKQAPLNILEVGTQRGGSLLAWKEFFPNANVYGVDVVDVVSKEYRLDIVNRIISDIKDWKNDIRWDIVIDDGSHYIPDIAFVISQYFVKLNIGGVVVVEDCRHPKLLMDVIENLLRELKLAFPHLEHRDRAEVKIYDNRKIGLDCSFITAIFKHPL